MSEESQSPDFRLAHAMMCIKNTDQSLEFYCGILGMQVLRRTDNSEGKFTDTFIGYGPEAEYPALELTENGGQEDDCDKGNGWGHICIETPSVYRACEELAAKGVTITRPPGPMKTAPV